MARYHIEPLEPLGLLSLDRSASPIAPKRVHLELDVRNGELSVTWQHNHETGVVPAVYHGFVRRWELPAVTNGEELSDTINGGALDNLFDRIVAGAERRYDGHGHVCRLSEDAADAEEAVDAVLYDLPALPDGGGLADAADWLEGSPPVVAADATDEALEAMAEQVEAEARNAHVVLAYTAAYLRELRQAARDAASR